MNIDLHDNPDFWGCHVVHDAETGAQVTCFYADDRAGVYRRFLRDEAGLVYLDEAAGELAWEEVNAKIVIAPRSPTAVADQMKALRLRAPEIRPEDVALIASPLKRPTGAGMKKTK